MGVVFATVARKHDQTHHTAESQSQLQGGEHHVAGPAHRESRLRSGLLFTDNRARRADSSMNLGVPDRILLGARAEVSLDLSLVHSVQREHEEDPADRQSPEGVSLCRIRVQAEQEGDKFTTENTLH